MAANFSTVQSGLSALRASPESSLFSASIGAIAVVLISALWHLWKKHPLPRVGKSRIWTWLPFATPSRYELDKLANDGYLKV